MIRRGGWGAKTRWIYRAGLRARKCEYESAYMWVKLLRYISRVDMIRERGWFITRDGDTFGRRKIED